MELTDNFSISRLFMQKEVSVFLDKKLITTIHLKTARDFVCNSQWNGIYQLWTDLDEWHRIFPNLQLDSIIEYLELLKFELGKYKQYSQFVDDMDQCFNETFDFIDFDFQLQKFILNGVIITPEIWDYCVYLLKLSQGEKVTKPRTFNSEEERAFYMQQLEYEKRIQQIKQKGNSAGGDKEGLIKTCLYIVYAFPSLTLDYLFNQTMAQIYWLQKMAAESVSYSFNEKAFAAGNVKNGKKLDFFIK